MAMDRVLVVSFNGSTTIEEFQSTLAQEIGTWDLPNGFCHFGDDHIEKDLEHYLDQSGPTNIPSGAEGKSACHRKHTTKYILTHRSPRIRPGGTGTTTMEGTLCGNTMPGVSTNATTTAHNTVNSHATHTLKSHHSHNLSSSHYSTGDHVHVGTTRSLAVL